MNVRVQYSTLPSQTSQSTENTKLFSLQYPEIALPKSISPYCLTHYDSCHATKLLLTFYMSMTFGVENMISFLPRHTESEKVLNKHHWYLFYFYLIPQVPEKNMFENHQHLTKKSCEKKRNG